MAERLSDEFPSPTTSTDRSSQHDSEEEEEFIPQTCIQNFQ